MPFRPPTRPDGLFSAADAGDGPGGRSVAQRWLAGLERLGYRDPVVYLGSRREQGWPWDRIAAESGVSPSWLLRRRDRIEALFDPVIGCPRPSV